jgi:hypothetical protein
MKHLAEFSEIVGHVTHESVTCEVVATTASGFPDEARMLTIELDAFLRPVVSQHPEQQLRPGWLPRTQVITERAPEEEATDVAREVFRQWAHKVRDKAQAHAEEMAFA